MNSRYPWLLLCGLIICSGAGLAQGQIDVFEASISELQAALNEGSVQSVDLVDQYLARIEAYDASGPSLNSIIRVNPRARELADKLDAERAQSGPRSLLHGIPILVKDNYNTTVMPTTGGSVALANFYPNASATQIEMLEQAGAIVLAKTNLHEYAYGITSVSSLLGQTRNPYDIRRVPGGSSGGTGAAVAASFGAVGLGSDTCGSIRIPSAFNNLIGLRPTKGLSSIYGIMPLSHTQDVAGPLARTAEDLAITLDVVVGFDSADAATQAVQGREIPSFLASLKSADLSELRVGRLSAYMDAADSETRRGIDAALDWYKSQGAEVIDMNIPELSTLIGASGVIAHEFKPDLDAYLEHFGSEAVTSLEQIVDSGLHHEAIAAVLRGSSARVANAEAYSVALDGRAVLRNAILAQMEALNLDVIVYPPIAQLPVFIGNPQPGNNCSISANSGLPALSMPVGFSQSGLPIGMEVLGRAYTDQNLLAMAYPYERANKPRQAPPVTPPLENNVAPENQYYSVSFNRSGIALTADFQWQKATNTLSYKVLVEEGDGDVFAVTLAAQSTDDYSDTIARNLLGPDDERGSGEIFLSPSLRAGLVGGKLYLKMFSSESGVAGTVLPIQ